MGLNKNKIIRFIARLSAIVLLLPMTVPSAHARLYFTNDLFKNEAEVFRIGDLADPTATDLTLQFGSTNTETLSFNSTSDNFDLSDDLDVTGDVSVTGDFVVGSTGLSSVTEGTEGATLIGTDASDFSNFTPAGDNVQLALEAIDTALAGGGGADTWDDVYDNSSANAVLEIDDTHDVTFNLTATSDFYFQDGGSNVLEINDSGAILLDPTSGQNFDVTTLGAGDIVLNSADTIDADANIFDFDATAASNITVTASTAAEDLILEQAGAFDASVVVNAAGTGADAIDLNATGTGGGITADTTDGAIALTATGATNGDITFTAGDVFDLDAVDALSLNSSAGAINIGNDAVAQNINVGSGASARTIQVGNAASTAVNLDAIALSLDASESSNIGLTANNASDQTLTIAASNAGAGNGLVDISTDVWSITGAGVLGGITGLDATTEDTIEAVIFDADAEDITGVWEVQDDVAFQFGTDNDAQITYDATTDNRLEITGSDVSISNDLILGANLGIGTDPGSDELHIFTVGSNARVRLTATGGDQDTVIRFDTGNGGEGDEWSLGMDDTDGDAFKISQQSSLGTNDRFRIDISTGDITVSNDLTSTAGDVTVSSGDFVVGSTGLSSVTEGTEGATLIGTDASDFSNFTPAGDNVQLALEAIDTALAGGGGADTWDDVYDNSSANAVLEIDDTHDVTFNLTATSDFYFQDGGSNVFELNDSGAAIFTPTSGQNFSVTTAGAGDIVLTDPNWSITGAGAGSFTSLTTTASGDANIDGDVTVGSSTETIANGGFALDGDDLFVADNLGVEDDIYVEGSIFTDTYVNKYIWLQPGGGIRTSAAIGTVGSGNSPALRFDATNASNSVWSFALPDDADDTANMTVTVYWSPEDGNSGDVVFSLDYASYGAAEVIGTGSETDTTGTTVAAPGTTLEVVSSDMTMTETNIDISAGDMIHVNLGRDPTVGGDTYAGEISIHSVRVTYQGKKLQ